jgi:membrane protease YdiL (CAAX protease family)
MKILSSIIDLILAGYVIWEIIQFVPRFRKLKQDIANGDTQARNKIYQRAIVFEWISALLALGALGFDWSKLNPRNLAVNPALFQSISGGSDFRNGNIAGVLFGIAVGTAVFVVLRRRANRRGAVPTRNLIAPWFRKLLPDFSALLPVTNHERLVWAAVAVSAGICEEIVFRGWLLNTLHEQIGLTGTTLIWAGALIFGLAHAYQKIPGIVLTALAGAFFCVLYVKTGSLLLPIVLHALVDLRFAFLPAPRAQLTPVES